MALALRKENSRRQRNKRNAERDADFRDNTSRFFRLMRAIKQDAPPDDYFHAATVIRDNEGGESISFDPERVKEGVREPWGGKDGIYNGKNDPDYTTSEYKQHFRKIPLTEEAKRAAQTLTKEWTEADVIEALSDAKLKARIGEDGSSSFLLKHASEADERVISVMLTIFRAINKHQKYPEAWRTAQVVLLAKSDKKRSFDPTNHRPISCTCHMEKIFQAILTAKIQRYLETHDLLPRTQFGSRTARDCHQPLSVLVDIMEMAIAGGGETPVHIASVDIAKAFDTIPFQVSLDALRRVGIPEEIVGVVREMLAHRKATFATAYGYTDPIDVKSGVVQGTVIGPLLYLLATAALQEELEQLPGIRLLRRGKSPSGNGNGPKKPGVEGLKEYLRETQNRFEQGEADGKGNARASAWVSALQYVDDTIIIANSHEELQSAIDLLTSRLEACIGIKLNASKTVYVVVGAPKGDPHDRTIDVAGTVVPELDAHTRTIWERDAKTGQHEVDDPELVEMLQELEGRKRNKQANEDLCEKDNASPPQHGSQNRPTEPGKPVEVTPSELSAGSAPLPVNPGAQQSQEAPSMGERRRPQPEPRQAKHARLGGRKAAGDQEEDEEEEDGMEHEECAGGETPAEEHTRLLFEKEARHQLESQRRGVVVAMPAAERKVDAPTIEVSDDGDSIARMHDMRARKTDPKRTAAKTSRKLAADDMGRENGDRQGRPDGLTLPMLSDSINPTAENRMDALCRAANDLFGEQPRNLYNMNSYPEEMIGQGDSAQISGRAGFVSLDIVSRAAEVIESMPLEDRWPMAKLAYDSFVGDVLEAAALEAVDRLASRGARTIRAASRAEEGADVVVTIDLAAITTEMAGMSDFGLAFFRTSPGFPYDKVWAAVCTDRVGGDPVLRTATERGAYEVLWELEMGESWSGATTEERLDIYRGVLGLDVVMSTHESGGGRLTLTKASLRRQPETYEAQQRNPPRNHGAPEEKGHSEEHGTEEKNQLSAQLTPKRSHQGGRRDADGREAEGQGRVAWATQRLSNGEARHHLVEAKEDGRPHLLDRKTGELQPIRKRTIPDPTPRTFRYLGIHLSSDLSWRRQEEILLDRIETPLQLISAASLTRAQVRLLVDSCVMSRLLYVLVIASVSDEFIAKVDRMISAAAKKALGLPNSYANALMVDPVHGAGIIRLRDAVDRLRIRLVSGQLAEEDTTLQGAVSSMRAREVMGELGVGPSALEGLTRWVAEDPEEPLCPARPPWQYAEPLPGDNRGGTGEPRLLPEDPPRRKASEPGMRLRRQTIPRQTNTRFEAFLQAMGRTGVAMRWKEGYSPLLRERTSRPTLTSKRAWVDWERGLPGACRSWRYLDELVDGTHLKVAGAITMLHDPEREAQIHHDPWTDRELSIISKWAASHGGVAWQRCAAKLDRRGRTAEACRRTAAALVPGTINWMPPRRRAVTTEEHRALQHILGDQNREGGPKPSTGAAQDVQGPAAADSARRNPEEDTTGERNVSYECCDIIAGDVVACCPQLRLKRQHAQQGGEIGAKEAFTWWGVVRSTTRQVTEVATAEASWLEAAATTAGMEMTVERSMWDDEGQQLALVEQIVPCYVEQASQHQFGFPPPPPLPRQKDCTARGLTWRNRVRLTTRFLWGKSGAGNTRSGRRKRTGSREMRRTSSPRATTLSDYATYTRQRAW